MTKVLQHRLVPQSWFEYGTYPVADWLISLACFVPPCPQLGLALVEIPLGDFEELLSAHPEVHYEGVEGRQTLTSSVDEAHLLLNCCVGYVHPLH